MCQSVPRAIRSALVVASVVALAAGAATPRAGLLAPRPGPIDRPLALAVADFDRDGLDDIAVADYQAAILNLLVGRADGTFVPHPSGPIGVGTTTISNPTTAPFQLIALDLNPEDVDADTVPNASDNCPNVLNLRETDGTQLDANDNGIGDACEAGVDVDGDGLIDTTLDTDLDNVLDYDPITQTLDNCPRWPNSLQEDTEVAAGLDGICGTADDNTLLFGADAQCGTLDDRIGDGVGDACRTSPDLVILSQSAGNGSVIGTLRVRMNTGSGGFVGNRPTFSTSVGPGAMAVSDYNKDGRIDVALTNTTFAAMEVFPGLGDGRFDFPAIFVTGKGPQGLAWGDFDGDGDADIAIGNRADDTLSIFLNAAGVLPPVASATPQTVDAPTVLLSGLLNNDLLADIVVVGQGAASDDGKIQVFLGAPGGALLPLTATDLGAGHAPRSGILADLDGNGTLDLALADFPAKAATIWNGGGDGTFAALPTTVLLRDQPTDLATIDLPPAGGLPGLAVLQFNARVDLLGNGGGLSFAAAPTTPASVWKDVQAMVFTGADLASGGDLVLLERSAARFDVLSGAGDNSFRYQSSQRITGLPIPRLPPPNPTPGAGESVRTSGSQDTTVPGELRFMQAADIAFNGRQDLVLVDDVRGNLILVTNELTGVLREQKPLAIPPAAGGLSTGFLVSTITDYDRDGVPNRLDNCPTIYNPPGCTVTDPACPRTIECTDLALSPTNCTAGDPLTTDPATLQCDSDRNGIGDHCQILSVTCANIDPDFDLVPQYDLNALKRTDAGQNDFDVDDVANLTDNCPTIANSSQADADANGVGDACEILSAGLPVDPDFDGVFTWNPADDAVDNCPEVSNADQADNDADRVGNACVIAKALDNCPSTLNPMPLNGDQPDVDGDGLGNACATAPSDLLIPHPAAGTVTLLEGDGSGFLRQPAASPLTLLPGATGAVTGFFSLDCFLLACFSHTKSDIAVATRGAASGPADDGVTVFVGDDLGSYVRQAAAPAAGDPSGLQVIPNQSVCSDPDDPLLPTLRHDPDDTSDLLVVTEPGASQIRILIGSNRNFIDPMSSPLVPPVGHPAPLPTPADLRAVASLDLNRDGLGDLVAVAGPAGGTTTFRVFMGLGAGLFYTDPTLDPDPIAGDELGLPQTGFINIQEDSLYPDLALFSRVDQAPFTLFNILPERADIDRSGRVDGFDLVALARSFGESRGEDFILQSDATFQQTGSGWSKRLVASGSRPPGQDLAATDSCGTLPVLGSGLYGLPVDINLDGIVDGVDLAILASRFGLTLP